MFTDLSRKILLKKNSKLKTVKRNLVDSVISVDRNIVKSLTMDDIKEIFSVD
ncbi:MAG: hypothetical protein ACLSA2_06760 [Candidatus Gastranaerophilaceae bacterium]